VEAGQITAAEARKALDRNVVTRAVGSELQAEVDLFGPLTLLPDQRLILCSDGVHGMIEDTEIAQLAGLPIAESAAALVAAALDAGGRDNATALVGGFEPVAEADAEGEDAAAAAPEAARGPSPSDPPTVRRSPRQSIAAAITRSRPSHD
jgi:protein phosphatase